MFGLQSLSSLRKFRYVSFVRRQIWDFTTKLIFALSKMAALVSNKNRSHAKVSISRSFVVPLEYGKLASERTPEKTLKTIIDKKQKSSRHRVVQSRQGGKKSPTVIDASGKTNNVNNPFRVPVQRVPRERTCL